MARLSCGRGLLLLASDLRRRPVAWLLLLLVALIEKAALSLADPWYRLGGTTQGGLVQLVETFASLLASSPQGEKQNQRFTALYLNFLAGESCTKKISRVIPEPEAWDNCVLIHPLLRLKNLKSTCLQHLFNPKLLQ